MFNLIRQLQQKPESSRRTIAFGFALVTTVLIVIVWLTTLGPRFSTEAQERTNNAPSPLQSFKESFTSLFSGTSEFQQIRDTMEENTSTDTTTSTSTPHTTTSTTSTTAPTTYEKSTSTDSSTSEFLGD